MSSDEKTVSPFVHVHDMEGDVIHKHIKGVTLGEFFNSLDITFNNSCFTLDNGTAYCNNGNKKLRMYVNNKENNNRKNNNKLPLFIDIFKHFLYINFYFNTL